MKTLFLLVVAAMLATTATAQREVIDHERFLSMSTPILTADHDSLFVVSYSETIVTGRWYDVSSRALIGTWTTYEFGYPSAIHTESDLAAVFVSTIFGSLKIIDAVTGATLDSIPEVNQFRRVATTDTILVWQQNGILTRRSLSNPSEVTVIRQEKSLSGDELYEFQMDSFNGWPRFWSEYYVKRDFILVDGVRKPMDRHFDLAGTAGIESFKQWGDSIVVRNAVTNDRLYVLPPPSHGPVVSAVLSHDGNWLLWMSRSDADRTTLLHAVDLKSGAALDPVEISPQSHRVTRILHMNGWMKIEMDESRSTYFRFDSVALVSEKAVIEDPLLKPLPVVGGRSLALFKSESTWTNISSLNGDVLFNRGVAGKTAPYSYLAGGRYLTRRSENEESPFGFVDLYDITRSPVTKTHTISTDNLDIAQLRRFETEGTWVGILDALTDRLIFETDLPAPYKVRGDFEKVFEPHRMILDTQGVVFYNVFIYDRLWTQRPGERSFSLLWNGGLFRDLVFPGKAEHAYVVMYNDRVGRFSRIDGSFKGYMDERTPLHTISSIAVDPTTNGLIFSTPSALVFWDPIRHMITDSIPFPAGVRGSWRVDHVSKDRHRIVIKENISSRKIRAVLLSHGEHKELPTFTRRTRVMVDGLVTVTENPDGTIRVASTIGNEEIDLGQGTSTNFELFDNDSSIVFFGQDSTVIFRHLLRNGSTQWNDPSTSVAFEDERASQPNQILNSDAPYSIDIPDVEPGAPCSITIRGLDGSLVQQTLVTPLSDRLSATVSIEGLAAGMYAVSVSQASRVLLRQCVLVSP